MLREISSRQFMEWEAYAAIEPWDEERADARAGMIVKELRHLRGAKRVALKDCVLKYPEPPAVQSPAPTKEVAADARARAVQQVRSVMEMLKAVHNQPQKAGH